MDQTGVRRSEIREILGVPSGTFKYVRVNITLGVHLFQLKMASDKLVDMARLMNINEVNRYYRQLRQTGPEEEEEYVNTPKLDVNAFYLKYFDKLSKYITNISRYNVVSLNSDII